MSEGFRRMRPSLGTGRTAHRGPRCGAAARACDRRSPSRRSRLMSFHEAGSDLGRLHLAGAGTPVRVDARTYDVLDQALCIAAATQGRFDPTVAAQQVARGLLPRPASPWAPDFGARWHDVELIGGHSVRLAKPLWIDLGGIAKGYAVDRAVELLVAARATQVCVNAGGDIRVAGPHSEISICARTPASQRCPRGSPTRQLPPAPGRPRRRRSRGSDPRNGCTRRPVDAGALSFVASRCVVADALTKVIMAGDSHVALQALEQFDAQARVHVLGQGWSPAGAAA